MYLSNHQHDYSIEKNGIYVFACEHVPGCETMPFIIIYACTDRVDVGTSVTHDLRRRPRSTTFAHNDENTGCHTALPGRSKGGVHDVTDGHVLPVAPHDMTLQHSGTIW